MASGERELRAGVFFSSASKRADLLHLLIVPWVVAMLQGIGAIHMNILQLSLDLYTLCNYHELASENSVMFNHKICTMYFLLLLAGMYGSTASY